MKSAVAILVLASLFALAYTAPGPSRESSDEATVIDDKNDGVMLVLPNPRNRGSSFDSIEDDEDDEDQSGSVDFWHPFPFERSGFLDSGFSGFRETLNRVKAQIAAAMSGFKEGSFTPWGKVPEGANTTSTTKVIGNHAVTINETSYSEGDENSQTIFRVRVVDVKPLNETADAGSEESGSDEAGPSTSVSEDEEPTTKPSASRSVETVEEFDNEIPKAQVETFAS